jgi:hypothetical protein
MFEKLKRKFHGISAEKRGEWIGFFLLVVFILGSYQIGVGHGRREKEAEIPALAMVSARLERIETMALKNPVCGQAVADVYHSTQP